MSPQLSMKMDFHGKDQKARQKVFMQTIIIVILSWLIAPFIFSMITLTHYSYIILIFSVYFNC